jgi:hypothetical protein
MTKLRSLCFLLPFLVASCAAPQATQQEAQRSLRGPCLNLFLNSSFGGYQHVVAQFGGKAVFAVAEDKRTGAQKCGVGRSNSDLGSQSWGLAGNEVSWEQLEALAIARCEAQKGITESCVVFARNNEIVWKKRQNVDFK